MLKYYDIDFSVETDDKIYTVLFTNGLENGTVRGLLAVNYDDIFGGGGCF